MRFAVSVFSCLIAACACMGAVRAAEAPIVVAAENTWGDLAAQVAEPDMHVHSILASPALDPHLYEPGPAEGRLVHDATLIVANGAGYDAWIDRLAQARGGKQVPIVRADGWSGWHEGDNVHLWYNLAAVASFVGRFVVVCQQVDPAHAQAYEARGKTLLAAVDQVRQQVVEVRSKTVGQPVAATEPVFTPLADSLGLHMTQQAFQQAIMNDVEPPASAVAAFERDISQHHVRLVAYNAQADRPSVQRLIAQARQEKIPVLPVLEIMPPDQHWQTWVQHTVTQVAQAFGQEP
ncbi:periplasmic solute binding protein [Acetobacter senegalensis]|uniref:Periplasmic solute binding protein n=1 Tax=Acetobacter senegalensis TaxID=446692 RepID=A0A0U5BBS9_9PROT|nr:periplasmic solute binding protein [Acetobacter senegalensis]